MSAHILYLVFIYPLERGMEFVLSGSYEITGNYGISIIIMSIVVNIVLLPLYYLAEKWQGDEKELRKKMKPELDKIKKAFRGEERYYYTKAVYRRFSYNPVKALRVSFGFFIQVPFFFAAYHFLSHYNDLSGVSFFIFNDLYAPDRFIAIAGTRVNVMPFVMTAVNILSAVVYTTNMERKEKIQLWVLAFVFFILLYNSPSALVFYWTLNNLFSLVKNVLAVHVFKFEYVS